MVPRINILYVYDVSSLLMYFVTAAFFALFSYFSPVTELDSELKSES